MRQLVLLYWGCVFLMYLSQVYYPVKNQLQGCQSIKCHFMRKKSDIFIIIIIFWLSAFSFLRTSYNDSPLSSKKQKNNCRQRHPGSGCPFFQLFSGYLFACSSVKQRFCPYYFHTGWYLYLMPLTKQTRLPTPIF